MNSFKRLAVCELPIIHYYPKLRPQWLHPLRPLSSVQGASVAGLAIPSLSLTTITLHR